jgi:hypothetical protein
VIEDPRRSRFRPLALPGVVIVLFWLAAQVVSGIPSLHVLATSVDGLVLADYRQDPLQVLGMAPLSGQIYSDAYRDALSGPHGVSWVWFSAPSGGGRLTTAAPSVAGTPTGAPAPAASGSTPVPSPPAAPSATASPTPSGQTSPTPTGWPSSSATPSPSSPSSTGTPTPSPSAAGTPTPSAASSATPTPTPTPTPAPTATNAGTFAGRVVDWNTNGGIPNEVVSLNGGPTVMTDSTGAFTESVAAGAYLLTVSGGPYATQSQSITIRAGSKTTANIWLVPSGQAGIIQGTVTDSATGAPIVGAYVYINVPGLALYTDSSGRYTFTGLPAGSKTASVSAPNYTSTNLSSSVTAGGVTILNIKLAHV